MTLRSSLAAAFWLACALAHAQTSIAGTVREGTAGLGGVSISASGGPVLSGSDPAGAAIPDDSTIGITRTINLSGAGAVLRVEAGVNITHPFIADLRVVLRHPDGTQVVLHNETGGDSDDLITTYPTLTQPFGNLNALVGKAAAGAWQLTVSDNAPSDVGMLNAWNLRVVTGTTYGATTAADGAYSWGSLPSGEYLVVATRAGTRFTPPSRTVTTPPNATGVDFAVDTGGVSGRVLDRGMGVSGATVRARLANSFATRNPNLAIPDDVPAGVSDALTIGGGGLIQTVSVFVNITHPFRGDLRLRLRHPDGTEVLLHDRTGDFADNLITSYPDETAPVDSMATLTGKAIAGTWRLYVADQAWPDSGTLVSWGLGFFTTSGAVLTATSGPDGSYAFPTAGAAAMRLSAELGAYAFEPGSRFRIVPPTLTGLDFTIATPSLAGITSPSVAMTPGQSQPGTISLSSPVGPAGPLTIALQSSASGVLAIPSSVSIPAGATMGTFSMTAAATATTKPVSLLASTGLQQAAMTVICGPAGRTYWYGGDFDGRDALRSEQNTENADARLYDGFSLPVDAQIRSVFGFFAETGVVAPAQARVQIRQGTSANHEGTLVYDGVHPADSWVAGHDFFGLPVRIVAVDSLAIELAAGSYHVTLAPVGNGDGGFYVCTTTGSRGLGTPVANGQAFLSWPAPPSPLSPLLAEPVESTQLLGPGTWDFQYGLAYVPATRYVSGVIGFNGLNPSATRPSVVTMQFRTPGTTQVVQSLNVGVAPDGSFTVATPGASEFDLALKHEQWLRAIAQVDTTLGDVTGVAFDLNSGDVNRDNRVDLDDFLILASTYEVAPPTDPNADLTGDGLVGLDDFLVLAASYELVGPD